MDRPLVAAVSVAVATSLAAVAGAVWLALGGAGADSEDRVATRAEFCAEYGDPLALMAGPEGPAFAETWRDYGRRLEETGLPARAPQQVRDGFVAFVERAQALPDEVRTPADIVELSERQGVDATADAAMLAFDAWAARRCGLEPPLG